MVIITEEEIHKNRLVNAYFDDGGSKSLLPVIKLTEPMTYKPWEFIPLKRVVIRGTDLFGSRGDTMKSIVAEIANSGSIQNWLGFDGEVVLSSIMPDIMLRGISKESYAYIINKLEFDYYFTPDGETYIGEEHLGRYEVGRILKETEFLLDECKGGKPIGLVKGSTEGQIKTDVKALVCLGIKDMVVHVGDFIRRGDEREIAAGMRAAKIARSQARELLIYGVGARQNIDYFGFGDSFITQSHFVNAFYRQKLNNGKWEFMKRKAERADVMNNLKEIYNEVIGLEKRGGKLSA